MKRGVVASPINIQLIETGGFRTTGGLSRTDINYYSLYWDKVVIPGSKEIYFKLAGEEELLSLGVIERPIVSIGSNSDNYAITFPFQQLHIYSELQKSMSDYHWVLHQIGSNLAFPTATDDRLKNLQFELYNALPVPSSDVHPADILEFKQKNLDAFTHFHNYLDELYKNVAYAPDEPLFQKKAFKEFKKSIKDINKISELQRGFVFNRYDLKVEIPNSKDLVTTVIGALISISDTSNPLSTGLGLLAAGIGFIKVTDKHKTILKSSNKDSNLMFLAKAYSNDIL
ncbi:hypothetical protein ITK20_001747 [Salmonella enterica]|nr:hypothetical protein [Salmonella enterica]EBF4011883.1 hypothetical protein [Salmonella enterica subsp. enterica serovar Alachua]EBS9242749.1 hypothetical protein [Salmonella enterica]EBW7758320.1 hypothetical protein [Salmonella enterica subsp. enterica serovar Alachua]ECD2606640.1 hypothetical protein [Salmonella enterica subsp. enterica serovar Alachua]